MRYRFNMTPAAYVKSRGRGGISQLIHDAKLAPPTVRRALRGVPIMRVCAERLVAATGGKVTLEEVAICGLPAPAEASA